MGDRIRSFLVDNNKPSMNELYIEFDTAEDIVQRRVLNFRNLLKYFYFSWRALKLNKTLLDHNVQLHTANILI